MLQIRENSIMSQHPFIFIGSLRCRAAVLSVVSLDHEKVKNGTLAAKIEAATNICKSKSTVPPSSPRLDRQN